MAQAVLEKAGKRLVSKLDTVKELDAKRAEAETLIREAEEIYKLSEDEHRPLTAEEEQRIAECLREADRIGAEVLQETEERHRAAVRQAIDQGLERQANLPEAAQVLSSGRLRYITGLQPRWQDDPKRGFSNSGEFYAAVIAGAYPNSPLDDRIGKIHQFEAAASGMSQGVGADGGIAVPPDFRREIWDGMRTLINNLLEMTDQYTVVGESLTMPAVAETSRTTGSRYGGIRGYWLAEAEEKIASFPKLRQMRLEPQELAVLVYMTDKLMRNAPALEDFVRRAASEEIMFMVNDAILNGTGTGMPLGILNSNGRVIVAKEGGQGAGTIVMENINKMYARMHPRARVGAVWLVNQEVEAQLENMSMMVGTGGIPVYLPAGSGFSGMVDAPNSRLKGRPVIPVEYGAAPGTEGDIIFANLGYYATGLQGAIRDDMSIHVRFVFNETALRFVFSMDGQPWINTPITPYKGSNTLSPFVTLETRA